jgi:hypothetical protein
MVVIGICPPMAMSPSVPRRTPRPRSAKPHASSESTDMMVNASCSSKRSMSLGLTLACLYALLALRAAPSSPSRSRRSCRAMVSVAADEARMRTGRAVNERAISVGHSTTAAAPSHTGELSSRFTGSAIILAAQKSSAVTACGNKAFGLPMAFLCALMANGAKSRWDTPIHACSAA